MAYYTWRSYKLKVNPFAVFTALSRYPDCFYLDSSLTPHDSLGRYSFLGINPFYTFKITRQNPFGLIRDKLEDYKIEGRGINFPFLGGAVGYFSYDLGLGLEPKVKKRTKDDPGIPDCYLGFYNTVIIIDHLKKLLYIFAVGFPEKKDSLAKRLCRENIKKMQGLLSQINSSCRPSLERGIPAPAELTSNFTRSDYLLAIKKAKEYIRQGDIYQINLSQMFAAQTAMSAPEIYGRLRRISPAYFSAYLDAGGTQIISSSPERFLKLQGGIVTTRPMKGTRRRGRNKAEDESLKKELLESKKDKAELMMIVDLERNDLGKVCSYDSIQAVKLRELEIYNTVFQTTATIQGRLHRNKDRMDLLRACFPGGSITGCPKIRAMEIIEELEPTRRSIYTGCLGYLSFSGDMDFNILIRTILKKGSRLYFGVGGGIVADSKPEKEYEETLIKARAMIEALHAAHKQ